MSSWEEKVGRPLKSFSDPGFSLSIHSTYNNPYLSADRSDELTPAAWAPVYAERSGR